MTEVQRKRAEELAKKHTSFWDEEDKSQSELDFICGYQAAVEDAQVLVDALLKASSTVGVSMEDIRFGGDGFQSTARHITKTALAKWRGE